jgi:hypothetical protein
MHRSELEEIAQKALRSISDEELRELLLLACTLMKNVSLEAKRRGRWVEWSGQPVHSQETKH